MNTREHFVRAFSEAEAVAIEGAAEEHGNGVNNANKGSNPFKWAILIVIGYQCAECDGYRKHHGITLDYAAFKRWVRAHGNLGTHDGDCDYLCLMGGGYNDWIPEPKEDAK